MRSNGLFGGVRKKASFLLLALAGAMLLGMPSAAGAQEVRWDDLEQDLQQEAELKGGFIPIRELGLKMWLPDNMKEAELDDALRGAGYLHYYKAEGEEDTAAITYVDMNGITLEDYETMVQEAGGSDLEEIDLNGLGAVSYRLESSNLAAVSFVTEKGYVLEFLFYPTTDADYEKAIQYMTGSIMSEE